MLTEKIELVEFPSIAFFAECLADFEAEAYNDVYATKPPDNPYFYLIASSQDSVAHYKRYANVVLQDAVNKGCDPKLIKTHLVVLGKHVFGEKLTQHAEDDIAGVYIRRNGVLLNLKIEEEYLIQDGAVYENGTKGLQRICSHLILPIGIFRDMDKGTEQVQIAMTMMVNGIARLCRGKKYIKPAV